MNKKNSYIFVLVVTGFTLLVLGDYVRGIGSTKLLSESMSNRLVGGPATGCEHKCGNGSCCDDFWLCVNWGEEDCNNINAKYNTNGKRDWVCRRTDGYTNCDATQNKVECAVHKHCYWDKCFGCDHVEETNWPMIEAMKCTDKDGVHTS